MVKTITTLALGILLGVLLITYVFNNPSISNNMVKELQSQNDSLLRANLKIDSINKELKQNLAKEDEAIELLNQRDIHLKETINELNTRIKTINKKYEKANKYSNYYNSNEISSYFSNLR